MSDSQGPVCIVSAKGVHPENLDQSVLEQKLISKDRLVPITDKMIFVFGSNEGGHHGAGAALYAYKRKGALMGVGFGPTGNAFAIPTKDRTIRRTLHLLDIRAYVDGFIRHANFFSETTFQVTAIGCGLAGLKHSQIAPMFAKAPSNCLFDTAWVKFLPDTARFWGTF